MRQAKPLIPQQGPMALLDRVARSSAEETVCTVVPDPHGLFGDASSGVPAWLGLEYMAQCIAVHGSLQHREDSRGGDMGFLVGSRKLRFHCSELRGGEELRVVVRPVHGTGGLMSFDCELRNGESCLAEGRVSVYVPKPGSEDQNLAS